MAKEFLSVPFEVKAADIKKDGIFEGYASLFDRKPDAHGDVVARGAFHESIAKGGRNETGIAMLWQHDVKQIPGVWIELEETSRGLRAKGRLAIETSLGKEIYELMKLAAELGTFKLSLSIGYDAEDFEFYTPKGSSKRLRLLKKISLWEISLVTFPAKLGASIIDIKNQITPEKIIPIPGGATYEYCDLAFQDLPGGGGRASAISPEIIKKAVLYLKEEGYTEEQICAAVGILARYHQKADGPDEVLPALEEIRQGVKDLEMLENSFEGLAETTKKLSEIEPKGNLNEFFEMLDLINSRINKIETGNVLKGTEKFAELKLRAKNLNQLFRQQSFRSKNEIDISIIRKKPELTFFEEFGFHPGSRQAEEILRDLKGG